MRVIDLHLVMYSVERYLKLLESSTCIAIVMEDIEGSNLSTFLPFPMQDFLNAAISIVEGLVAIHSNYVLHMDIKPSNIIYNTLTKELRISDFSVSHMVRQYMSSSSSP